MKTIKRCLVHTLKKAPIPFDLFRLCRGAKSAASLGVQFSEIYPQEEIPITPSRNIHPTCPSLDNAPAILTNPPLCRYDYSGWVTHHGGFITQDNYHIEELIYYKDRGHPHDNSIRLFQKYLKTEAPVLALVSASQHNYYHWHIQNVSQALHALKNGILDTIPPNYRIYAPLTDPHQHKSLTEIGLPQERFISSKTHPNLYSPHIITINVLHHPTRLAVEHWKRIRAQIPRDPTLPRRIYISRSKAKTRKIINEQALLRLLRAYQIQPFHLEELDYETQRRLAKNATIIIAPHGAGLTNILFAEAGTHILEIFPSHNTNICYHILASLLGHHHTHYLAPATDEKTLNMTIDVDLVHEHLKNILQQ
ncbi:MAG: glycosyltransferase family 61 protein [Chthoniobacterales bacterium]|nr:glycosyltransferase family 61 protein [Chthoniobacterales bacterium]